MGTGFEPLELAKGLFGRPLRIYLAGWIRSRDGLNFQLHEAQDAMREHFGPSATSAPAELRKLAHYGLLQEVTNKGRVYFTVLPSPLWECFDAIVRVLDIHVGAKNPTSS